MEQKFLKSTLDYNPDTGIFTWKVNLGQKARIGEVAGCSDVNGYIRIRFHEKSYLAHRLVFMWMKGYFPEHDVDHINRIKDDNSWKNLKEVSRQCNNRNQNLYKQNKSGVAGVRKGHNGIWNTNIGVDKKLIHLGCFSKKEDAVLARRKAEIYYKFPNCNSTSSAYLWLKEQGLLQK